MLYAVFNGICGMSRQLSSLGIFLSLTTDVITCRFAIKMSTGCTALQMRKARNLRKYSHLSLFEKIK